MGLGWFYSWKELVTINMSDKSKAPMAWKVYFNKKGVKFKGRVITPIQPVVDINGTFMVCW